MERDARAIILQFVRPLLQELDGHSRLPELERVRTIAERLLTEERGDDRLDRELFFHLYPLRAWLRKSGNRSRMTLALREVATEQQLIDVERSIGRIEDPQTPLEIALASALRIDEAGLRGSAQQISFSRREGLSLDEAITRLSESEETPAWMTARARDWLNVRKHSRALFVSQVRAELDLDDEPGRN